MSKTQERLPNNGEIILLSGSVRPALLRPIGEAPMTNSPISLHSRSKPLNGWQCVCTRRGAAMVVGNAQSRAMDEAVGQSNGGYLSRSAVAMLCLFVGVLVFTIGSSYLLGDTPRRVLEMKHPIDGVSELLVGWGSVSGWQPRLAGDVDGDGTDDLLIARRLVPDNPNRNYLSLVYGQRLEGAVEIASLRETRFVDTRGEIDPPELLPGCTAPHGPAGDVDGDGYDDFFLSVCSYARGGVAWTGLVILVYGAPDLPREIDLFHPDPTLVRTATFVSVAADSNAGIAMGTAGDFNADGSLDLYIADAGFGTENGAQGSGRVFVLEGGQALQGELRLDEVGRGLQGFVLTGGFGGVWSEGQSGDFLGIGYDSIDAGGDLNGDGFDDLVFGAWDASREVKKSGAAYVVYGGPHVFPDLSAAFPGDFGVELLGLETQSQFGMSVAIAGDVDGDAYDDLLAGASGGFPGWAGSAYLFFGTANWATRIRPNDPGVRKTHFVGTFPPFTYNEGHFGSVVSALGDQTGDGFADFLITAPRQEVHLGTRVGRAYAIHGGPSLPATVRDQEIGTAEVPGTVLEGPGPYQRLGAHVDAGGDFDGDGLRDVLILAPYQDYRNGTESTSPSHIYFLSGGAFLDPRLAVFAVEPPAAAVSGGASVTLVGRGFHGNERVFFGGVEATAVEARTSAGLAVTVPRQPTAGPVDVEVRRGQESVVLPGGFTYHELPPYPDLVLEPAGLSERGYRVLLYEDFVKASPEFPFRGWLKVFFHDLDGDGRDELFVGSESAIRAVFGSRNLPGRIGPGETQQHGMVITGRTQVVGNVNTGYPLSNSLVFPGDLDGDGLEDLLSPEAVTRVELFSQDAVTYLFYGRRDWAGGIDVEEDVTAGKTLVIPHIHCGGSRAAAPGDLAGNGTPALVLGYNGNDVLCRGAHAELSLYLDGIPRGPDPPTPTAVITGDPTPITTNPGLAEPREFGTSVASAGDVNGDGHLDLIVGGDHFYGACWVVLGGEDWPLRAGILDYIERGRAVLLRHGLGTADFGRVVAGPVDFNGDGLNDVVVGVPGGGEDYHGEVFVVFGSPELGRTVRDLDLREDGAWRLRIDGAYPFDWSGSVTSLGDWNQDGFGDLGIVGFDDRNREARAYVVLGEANPPTRIDLRVPGYRAFRIVAPEGQWYASVEMSPGTMASGDLDGDGNMDLAFPLATPEGKRVIVVYGRSGRPGEFVRGDPNDDGKVDLSDALTVLGYLFLGARTPRCLDAADANDNGLVDLSDAIYLLGFLFLGGTTLPPPHPEPGTDASPDQMGCSG